MYSPKGSADLQPFSKKWQFIACLSLLALAAFGSHLLLSAPAAGEDLLAGRVAVKWPHGFDLRRTLESQVLVGNVFPRSQPLTWYEFRGSGLTVLASVSTFPTHRDAALVLRGLFEAAPGELPYRGDLPYRDMPRVGDITLGKYPAKTYFVCGRALACVEVEEDAPEGASTTPARVQDLFVAAIDEGLNAAGVQPINDADKDYSGWWWR